MRAGAYADRDERRHTSGAKGYGQQGGPAQVDVLQRVRFQSDADSIVMHRPRLSVRVVFLPPPSP